MKDLYRVLVINPGSTSTKIALFENDKCLFSRSVFHDSSVLLKYDDINSQLNYRMHVIRSFLQDAKVDMKTIDAVVGRGGPCYACESGCYIIDEKLVKDTREVKGKFYHSSMLGVQMAYEFSHHYGMPAYMVDAPVVDELCDEARITGIKGVYRRATSHVLNAKETARVYAKSIGKTYEELNLIVAHIDGGISITAHHNGRIIDANDAGGGEGPFTPTRMGSMAVTDVLEYLFDKDPKEVRKLTSQAGGLSSWFNTSDAPDIYYNLVRKGDPMANRVWTAMLYQCSKWISMMAAPLEGKVDGILLTGGLMRIPGVKEYIDVHCGWIAPITSYPGEFEHESMAAYAIKVLKGEYEPKHYTGKPVWDGFQD